MELTKIIYELLLGRVSADTTKSTFEIDVDDVLFKDTEVVFFANKKTFILSKVLTRDD